MIYEITRTSVWCEEDKPCEDAIKKTVSTPHGELTVWTIEINTIEDLLSFISKNGKIILHPCKNEAPSIEIYDSYRE